MIKNFSFYYIKSNIDYILIIKPLNNYEIIKYIYSLSGVLINVTDLYKGDLIFIKSGNKQLEIKNYNIIKTTEIIRFKNIPKYIIKDQNYISNINIGVIYIETYLNDNDVNKIYALGFKTNLYKKPII